MSDVEQVRLVVKDYVRREDIDLVAQRERWTLQEEVPASEDEPYQKIWLTADMQAGINYGEDSILNVRYVGVRSYDPARWVPRIQAVIDTYNQAEIQGLVNTAQTPEQWISAIRKAAMAAPRQFDPQYFQMFQKALSHADPAVRRAGIEAAPYVQWREFEKPLEEMEKKDPQMGRDAAIMLQAMRTYHWREQPKAQ